MSNDEFIRDILSLFSRYDDRDSLYWNVEPDGTFRFFVKCSDLFVWASADLKEITPDNIGDLRQAYEDTEAADPVVGTVYASSLFVCRIWKMRPQGAAYPEEAALWPLFDACGPFREVGPGNPRPHPADRKKKEPK